MDRVGCHASIFTSVPFLTCTPQPARHAHVSVSVPVDAEGRAICHSLTHASRHKMCITRKYEEP